MRENRPSATAQRVAIRRALHQLVDHPRILDDPIALRIIGSAEASKLTGDGASAAVDPAGSALRAFLIARSRLAEDEVARAVREGVRQYVVLGAGLDTFAYRNPYGDSLRVFEVDHPATQNWKRSRLEDAGISRPRELTFVPVDFETTRLEDGLLGAGFDREAPAVVSWLGVTPYLEPESARATLRVVGDLLRRGGVLVFDYARSPASLDPQRRAAFEALADRVRAAGEPFRCFWEPDEIARELHERGFREVEDLGTDEINARYFANRVDGLATRGTLGRLIRAAV